MIRSLRWRILVGTSLASGIILAVIGVVLYSSMRSSLIAEFDGSALVQARALAGMTEERHGHLKFDADGVPPLFSTQSHPQYFELRTEDGKTIAKSQSLGGGQLTLRSPETSAGELPQYENLKLPDGHAGRGVVIRFTPAAENEDEAGNAASALKPMSAVVVFAKETAPLSATLSRLGRLLATVFGLAIVLSGCVLWAVVAGATRPLRKLANDIDAIRPDDLSLRVASEHVPSELRPVVERLNELLARLEHAFVREKAFASDVAHELRTPIAGLHTTLEVCRSRPRNPAEYELAIDKCLKMSEGIGSMIRTLLLMGRADAGQLVAERSTVDLAELLEKCWASFSHRAAARSIRVEMEIDSGTIEADLEKLMLIVNNLFDNAVSYVDERGTIRVIGKRNRNDLLLSITNTGSTISPEQIPLLVERFWRGDSARAATGLHCGLGLSLCQRVAPLIGGALSVTSQGGIFSACISLSNVFRAGAEQAASPGGSESGTSRLAASASPTLLR
jgi:signal transduction histidine kinase